LSGLRRRASLSLALGHDVRINSMRAMTVKPATITTTQSSANAASALVNEFTAAPVAIPPKRAVKASGPEVQCPDHRSGRWQVSRGVFTRRARSLRRDRAGRRRSSSGCPGLAPFETWVRTRCDSEQARVWKTPDPGHPGNARESTRFCRSPL